MICIGVEFLSNHADQLPIAENSLDYFYLSNSEYVPFQIDMRAYESHIKLSKLVFF